ncbi:MAG: bifunctional UDP-sugar hydrolase/5'-nucleotidase [Eubacteriales bacterium]|nr:bifunctional UDP-sugar hydrolase/5'-nucleotidase [Eubacteriales bacterium]MDD3882107.1 bifunctional UDP-sugar hydrolase/5'-nucleotidase [Eubacteriales bacterium]MDD4513212.1 bifunctional UDP-sugar hydrolase/5'-nucleotidase [Eubacteriales bacterium]
MRKKLSILLAIALLVCSIAPVALADQKVDLSGKLVILNTNDVHGYAITDTSVPSMGYAQIAAYKKLALSAGAEVLLLDAGDATYGQPIINLSKGLDAVKFMNAVGYDAMCPGNHEFDCGIDNLLQLADAAEFKVLAANITRTADGTTFFAPNTIFEKNGWKIGVFGLDTPEALTKANPALMKGVSIAMNEELYACAQAQVDELANAGCDLIICIGHLGIDDESTGNRSLDVIANTNGIDLFIDGHSHSEIVQTVDQKAVEGQETPDTTLLISTGCYSQNLGEIVFDGETLTATLIPASNAVVPTIFGDEEVSAMVAAVNDEINAQLSGVFAKTEVMLDGNRDPGVRTQETNLGDFAADAILWAANNAYSQPVAAAITNGGGIRASIDVGDISMMDMKTVFPFGNTIAVLTVKGSELLEAVEAATSAAPTALGAFPQVSGIEFTVDTSVEYVKGEQYPNTTYYAPANPGSRVTIATVGGEAFDPEKDYVIATNNFTAAGGDTYYCFGYAYSQTGYDTTIPLEDALVNYTAEVLGGVIGETYAAPAGRITIK